MLVVDFKEVSFTKYAAHGGGDFALRLIQFLINNNIEFVIINNVTGQYLEYSSEIQVLRNVNKTLHYFNPIYRGAVLEELKMFAQRIYYVHGLRMLEMPYDQYAYRYYKGIEKLKVWIKAKFFKTHYEKAELKFIEHLIERDPEAQIISPSEHSMYVIQSIFNKEISTKALPPFLTQVSPLKPSFNLPSRYILLLNGDRWVKNTYRYLLAFKQLKEQGLAAGVSLVVIGNPPFANEFSNDVHFLDYTDRPYLEYLMANCLFLAYPSLNEGFGYPPMDCFKYGRPVLCSSFSALNSVYNGLVEFANPLSIYELKARTLKLLKNTSNENNNEELQAFYNNFLMELESDWKDLLGGLND